MSLAPTFEYRYKTGEDEPEVQPERFCLFLIGDWGRENDANQAAVAQSMDQIADYFCQPLGVLSVGDNFQQTAGLDSIVDPEFNSSFSYPYRYETLQVPWFSLLGNVDYTDTTDCGSEVENEQRECLNFRAQMKRSPEYQVDPWIRRIDPRWFADRFFSLAVSDDIEFFFADTSVFVSEYYDQPWASGGTKPAPPSPQNKSLTDSSNNRFLLNPSPSPSPTLSGSQTSKAASQARILRSSSTTWTRRWRLRMPRGRSCSAIIPSTATARKADTRKLRKL